MDGMLTIDLIGTGVKTLAMLCIVLGIVVLILYTMKRMSLFNRGTDGPIRINVVSSLHLSPKEKIAVVEVTGEMLVLGITPGSISFLTKLDGPGSRNEEE